MPALTPAAKDENFEVRRAAISALAFGPPEKIAATILSGLSDANWQVREAAALLAGKKSQEPLQVSSLPLDDTWQVSGKAALALGKMHTYADRIATRQDSRIVTEHPRNYGRGETIYDPWHYVPVLARKPDALRNGAPFKDAAALERVRRRLSRSDDGDRQTVATLPKGAKSFSCWQQLGP